MSRCYNHIIYTMCYVEEKLSSIQLDITKIWKSTLKLLKISATSEKKRKKKKHIFQLEILNLRMKQKSCKKSFSDKPSNIYQEKEPWHWTNL